MKRIKANMKTRIFIILLIVTCSLAATVMRSDAQNKFKLKPGAQGKICLGCHAGFADKLKSAFR